MIKVTAHKDRASAICPPNAITRALAFTSLKKMVSRRLIYDLAKFNLKFKRGALMGLVKLDFML